MKGQQKRAKRGFFAGKVAVVTGGSRGFGLAITRRLLALGATVAVCARDPREIEAVRELLGHEERFYAQRCDVTSREEAGRFIADVTERFGAVDILINNAGTIVVGPYVDMTVEDIRQVVDVNFFAAVNTIDAVVPQMRLRRRGNIVNIGSIGGVVPVPHLAAYCAGKFALNGFSQTLHAELRRDGIRVSVVNPGLMRTGSPMNATFKGRTQAEYGWFVVSDSLPLLTMSADRAAAEVLRACRQGRPWTALSLPSKLAAGAHAVSPNLVTRVATLANALLPRPSGDRERRARGHESESPLTRSPLTSRAAAENNELAAQRGASDLPG